MPTGAALCEMRRAAGITQAEVARRLKVVPPFVSLLEAGKRRSLRAVEFYEGLAKAPQACEICGAEATTKAPAGSELCSACSDDLFE